MHFRRIFDIKVMHGLASNTPVFSQVEVKRKVASKKRKANEVAKEGDESNEKAYESCDDDVLEEEVDLRTSKHNYIDIARSLV
jgi:hypothetical protein